PVPERIGEAAVFKGGVGDIEHVRSRHLRAVEKGEAGGGPGRRISIFGEHGVGGSECGRPGADGNFEEAGAFGSRKRAARERRKDKHGSSEEKTPIHNRFSYSAKSAVSQGKISILAEKTTFPDRVDRWVDK